MKTFRTLQVSVHLIFILCSGISCTNADDCGDEASKFSTLEISEVTSTSFNVYGVVTPPPCERLNVGFGTGIVLSTEPDPDLENGIDYGRSSLTYDLIVIGLKPETKYYIKPYFIIGLRRYELGDQYEVTTLSETENTSE